MAAKRKKKGFFAALRRLVIFLFIVSVICGGAFSYGYYLWNSMPAEYQVEQTRRQVETPDDRRKRAMELEQRFVDMVHKRQAQQAAASASDPDESREEKVVAMIKQAEAQAMAAHHEQQAELHKQPRVAFNDPQRASAGFFVPSHVVADPVRRSGQPQPEPQAQPEPQPRPAAQPQARAKPTATRPSQPTPPPSPRPGNSGLTYSGGDSHIDFSMTMNEANDWLEFGLPRWLESSGRSMPPSVSDLSLTSVDGQPVVMFRYNDGKLNQIVSVRFHVEVYGEGRAKLTLHSVKGGELPVPVSTLTHIAVSMFPPEMQSRSFARVQSMFQGQEFDPSFPVSGGQERRRLERYNISQDMLQLQFRAVDPHSGRGTFQVR